MVELDLQTLESEHVHRAETAIWPTTTKGYVLWALAALGAITLGVIPALWINRWRHGDAVAALAPREPRTTATAPAAEPAEPAEPAEADAAPAPAAAAPTVEMPAAPVHSIAPAGVKATKRSKPDRTKPASSRARKQQQSQQPTCNVYLHPKGCPR